MSWDLAESSKDFVTTVVNKNDLVPSFGKVSASELRTKVPHMATYFHIVMRIQMKSLNLGVPSIAKMQWVGCLSSRVFSFHGEKQLAG